MHVRPYHAIVPSFGEWGFVLASPSPLREPSGLPEGLRYLDDRVLPTLFVLSPDMGRVPTEPNRLSSQALVRYYESAWREPAP